jgi:prophage regulatory protein
MTSALTKSEPANLNKAGTGTAPPDVPTSSVTVRLLRPRTVCERTGLSRSTLWRLERRGDFPPHRQISTNAVGWLEEEVNAWIRSRASR